MSRRTLGIRCNTCCNKPTDVSNISHKFQLEFVCMSEAQQTLQKSNNRPKKSELFFHSFSSKSLLIWHLPPWSLLWKLSCCWYIVVVETTPQIYVLLCVMKSGRVAAHCYPHSAAMPMLMSVPKRLKSGRRAPRAPFHFFSRELSLPLCVRTGTPPFSPGFAQSDCNKSRAELQIVATHR